MDSAPIPYLQRIRNYYLTLGYEKPYQWANFDQVPFSRLQKPLRDCRIGLVSTAAPYQSELGDQGPGAAYNAAAKFYSVYALPSEGNPDVRISHVGYDRDHTDATDANTWFPLPALKHAVQHGDIGSVSARFYGLPTNRSQSTTMDRDCVQLLELVNEDAVDAVVLVPNCPVCHQSCSLAARHLEKNGVSTVILGCAKDIVEHVGVPRLLFSDFPLGNGAGKPGDKESQQQTLALGLQLLTDAVEPRTTVQSPITWSSSDDWKQDFYNIEKLSNEAVQSLRQEFDQQKNVANKNKKRDGL